MRDESVDPQDVSWEVDQPVYRVHYWWQPERGAGEGWNCEEHRVHDANSVEEVLRWARECAQGREVVVYVETTNGGARGLLRLFGKDPHAVASAAGDTAVRSGVERFGEVQVVARMLYLSTSSWYDYANLNYATGLATANGPLLAILPGLHSGPVMVRTLLLESAPERLDEGVAGRAWEDVVEVSVSYPETPISVISMQDAPPSLVDITDGLTGNFRARVHALGRSEDFDLAPKEVHEHFLVQLWPAPPAREQVLVGANHFGGRSN